MKKFLILGLGSFGLTLAKDLKKRGNEVAAVDNDEERVNAARDSVDQAIIADATKLDVLEQLRVQDFDTVVVNLGDRIDASILTTLHLKQMNAREIVVKGISEDHAAILQMIGADQVVFPEQDIALRLSYILSHTNVLDQIALAPGYRVIELPTPPGFFGKTLEQVDLRRRYGIQLLLVKQMVPEATLFPTAEFVFKHSDVLVLMGKDEDLSRLQTLK